MPPRDSKLTNYNVTYVDRANDTNRGVVCVLSGALTHHLNLLQDLALPYPVESLASPVYEIREISQLKGKGMLATRSLQAGDLILDERALIVLPVSALRDTDVLRQAFNLLSQDDQRAFLSLYNRHKNAKPEDLLTNILQTNAYILDAESLTDPSDPQREYAALFNDISRANHDCSPNVVRSWSNKTLSMQLRASRAIAAGEEINSFYIPPTWPSAQRGSHLLQHYGFSCHCNACHDPGSDSRRTWIEATDVPSINANESMLVAMEKTLKVIDVVEGERLESAPVYSHLLFQATIMLVMAADMRATQYGKKLYKSKMAGNLEPSKYRKYAELEAREDIMRLARQLKTGYGP